MPSKLPAPTNRSASASAAPTPLRFTDQLALPGRTLVFCDDTELVGQPVSTLEPDVRILVAVQMASEGYAAFKEAMVTALQEFRVSEFHATDIATGNGPWKGRPEEERLAALGFVAGQLATHAARVGAVWLPKGQYPSLKEKAQKLGSVGVGFKHGLKRALVRSVVARLAIGSRPALVLLDQDSPIEAPKLEQWPEAKFLVGGGPVVSPSHLMHGLQLADLAIWSVQRFQTKRTRFDDGSASAFDKIARNVVASFPNGLDDLRGDAHGDWAP